MGRKRIYESNEVAVERNREMAVRRSREKNDSVKEIGPLPKVVNPSRKRRCRKSLLDFMLTYGGEKAGEEFVFVQPFCDEQLYMIRTLEDVLQHGGEVPLCIFRGGCKTTFCEWGLLWASLYGFQKFGLIVAASCGMARKIIANIKRMIQHNSLIQNDFPEACYPILRLEKIAQRANAQMLDGEYTEIVWSTDTIRFPKVKNAPSSQAIIYGVGAESSFRGLRVGKQRPTVVLIDDPQTNESAHSVTQTESRWENITTSMKGLAGPGVDLAMIATITVIQKGDLAEKILERWNGKRFGILRSMPKNMDAWEEYNEMQVRTYREVTSRMKRREIVNEYYREHQEILDEGAEAAWKTNFTKSEVSAIQHAMELYFFDKKAFWSEYMNQPPDNDKDSENLTIQGLETKIRKDLPKGIVPLDAEKITAGIDIQKDCLYWLVAAWSDDFSGHVLDYGRFPKGGKKMENVYPGCGFEEQVSLCLSELGQMLEVTTYRREGGEALTIDKIIVDANWGKVSTQVKKVCKTFRKDYLEPCFGWGFGPERRFFAQKKRVGEIRGPEWTKKMLELKGIVRSVTYNTNWWKSFVRSRIQAGLYAKSTLSFYAGDYVTHQKLFQHILGETSSKLTGQYGIITFFWNFRATILTKFHAQV